MSKLDLVFMSVRSLWRRKLRSSLTILGVVIGTASIVLMISLALAMNQNYENQVNQWGALTLIEVTQEDSMDSLVEVEELDEDALSTFAQLPYVESVIPYISTTMNVSVGDYNSMREVTIVGLDADELESLSYTASEGRLYDTDEQSVAIVGGAFTDQLAKRGQQLGSKTNNSSAGSMRNMGGGSGGGMPNMGGGFGGGMPNMSGGGMPNMNGMMPGMMGEEGQSEDDSSDIDVFNSVVKLTYQTFSFRTFGGPPTSNSSSNSTSSDVATPKATTIEVVGMLESGNEDTDNYIFMPREDVLNLIRQKAIYEAKLSGSSPQTTVDTYDKVTIKISDSNNVSTVQSYIEALGYSTSTAQDTLEEMESMSSSIQLILMGIGAISLIVSAIGITNTMMMSISERTKEIGVMKVISAVISDIKQMFLVEAAIIGLIGGAIGVGICYICSWLLNTYAVSFFGDLVGASNGAYETYVSIIPGYLAIAATLFAAIIGLIAGYMPAKRATALSALTALRAD